MLFSVFFIMFSYYNFDIIHTAVWNLAIISVYYIVECFIVFEMFIDKLEKYFPYICFYRLAERWGEVDDVSCSICFLFSLRVFNFWIL